MFVALAIRAGTDLGTLLGRNEGVWLCVWPTLLCAIGTARAAMPLQVSYEDSFGLDTPIQANWGTGSGTYSSVVLDLRQFDPTLGTLQKIRIDLHSSASGSL